MQRKRGGKLGYRFGSEFKGYPKEGIQAEKGIGKLQPYEGRGVGFSGPRSPDKTLKGRKMDYVTCLGAVK